MADDDPIQNEQSLDDGLSVEIHGDIDYGRTPQLRVELMRLLGKQPARLVIDLSHVSYMDSSGVAALVEALQKQRNAGGKLVLCGLQDKVLSIFKIARLDMVFTITEDLAAAKTA